MDESSATGSFLQSKSKTWNGKGSVFLFGNGLTILEQYISSGDKENSALILSVPWRCGARFHQCCQWCSKADNPIRHHCPWSIRKPQRDNMNVQFLIKNATAARNLKNKYSAILSIKCNQDKQNAHRSINNEPPQNGDDWAITSSLLMADLPPASPQSKRILE